MCPFTCYKDMPGLQATGQLFSTWALQKLQLCPELSCCRTIPPYSCKSTSLNTTAIMHVSCCPLHLDYCLLVILPTAYYLFTYYAI